MYGRRALSLPWLPKLTLLIARLRPPAEPSPSSVDEVELYDATEGSRDMAVPGRTMENESVGEVESAAASGGGDASAVFANDEGKNSSERREKMVFSVS